MVSAIFVSAASTSPPPKLLTHLIVIVSQLALVILANCFPSRIYGELELYMSTFKLATIILISMYIVYNDLSQYR